MNAFEAEKQTHQKKKIARRQEFFKKRRPDTTRKASKLCCGIKGCPNEAIKLKGALPYCDQHK